MLEKVLIFNCSGDVKALINRTLLPLKVRLVFVEKEDYSKPLGVLAGLSGIIGEDTASDYPEISDTMIVFAFFGDKKLNSALSALKKGGLNLPYKAVLTDENKLWPANKCFNEIKQEHEKLNNR
ncbi:MAG: DUF3783 domain-containing protein [Clostridiales bacterium]|nr:DUF3783 domain-containing protein [Clostridiales bacterium]